MKPTAITAHRKEKEVLVAWEDGHAGRYSFSILRAGCPCAACRGGHENMGDTPDPSVFEAELPDTPATQLKTILPVGAYALTPVWEDGHDAGIYRWEYLRALCACEQCRIKRTAA
jgi:DUF971 family protein